MTYRQDLLNEPDGFESTHCPEKSMGTMEISLESMIIGLLETVLSRPDKTHLISNIEVFLCGLSEFNCDVSGFVIIKNSYNNYLINGSPCDNNDLFDSLQREINNFARTSI